MVGPASPPAPAPSPSRRAVAGRIVGLCVLASVGFGVPFDILSCHACLEYFTVHHPPVFDTENPWLLGLCWGVFATWWMGAIFGSVLAVAATAGSKPPVTARQLARPLALGLAGIFAAAVLLWIGVYAFATWGPRWLGGPEAAVPAELDRRLVASALAHNFAYSTTALLGIVMSVATVLERRRGPRDGGDERKVTTSDPG